MRKELANLATGLEFDEELHQYIKQGKKYTSATTILQDKGIVPSFAAIDNMDFVQAARKRGVKIHKEISDYVLKLGILQDTEFESDQTEAAAFARAAHLELAQETYSEQMLCDDEYMIAGRADLIYRHQNDGPVVIVDIKTAKKVDLWEAAWQLSIYRYMLRKIIDVPVLLQVATFTPNGNVCNMNDVSFYIPDEELISLLEAHKNGIPYDTGKIVLVMDTRDLAEDAVRIETAIKRLKDEITYRSEALDSIRGKLYKSLLDHDVKSVVVSGVRITRIDESFRKIVDSARLKTEHPDMFDKYTKLTHVKPTVKFTFNNTEVKIGDGK
jgi:hypothetical protein